MTRTLRLSAIALAAVGLTACSFPQNAATPHLSSAGVQPLAGKAINLYVANAHNVSVYALNSGTLIRTIDNSSPTATKLGPSGNLFVANAQTNTVTIYARDSNSVLKVIKTGLTAPKALAFDPSGDLYVANNKGNSVTVYSPGDWSLIRKIVDSINGPQVLLFDKSANLYVGNNGSSHITVYPLGQTSPSRTIVTHNGPLALAFGRTGYLFSVNNFNVTVYAPGRNQPSRTITDGISLPSSLAIGDSGYLYVANWGVNIVRSNVTIYAPGSSTPAGVITQGIGDPQSLKFDAAGDLYVSNYGYNTVTEYAPKGSNVKRTFKRGISAPAELALGL